MASGTLVWFAALSSLGLFTVISRGRRRKSKDRRRSSDRPAEDRDLIATLRDPALRVLLADTRTLRRALYADPALDECRVDQLQLWADAVRRLSTRYPPLSAAPVELALRATHRDEIERALAVDLGLRRVEQLILRYGRTPSRA